MGFHWRNTLTSPTIQGTVGAGTGLTLPAFTSSGDISIGANAVKTTNISIDEVDANNLEIANYARTTLKGLLLNNLSIYATIAGGISGIAINATNANAGTLLLKARDTGVGLVEVARLIGAADPYFGIGVDGSVLKGTNGGLLGFFAATPVAKQTGCAVPTDLTTAIAAITALRTALNTLGLTTVV